MNEMFRLLSLSYHSWTIHWKGKAMNKVRKRYKDFVYLWKADEFLINRYSKYRKTREREIWSSICQFVYFSLQQCGNSGIDNHKTKLLILRCWQWRHGIKVEYIIGRTGKNNVGNDNTINRHNLPHSFLANDWYFLNRIYRYYDVYIIDCSRID